MTNPRLRSVLSLGKFGVFPSRELIGKRYGVTYEIVSAAATGSREGSEALALDPANDKKGKNGKGKGKGKQGNADANNGESTVLLPVRKARMEELGKEGSARMCCDDSNLLDLAEETSATNDLIDDLPAAATQLLPAEEIIALREAGLSAEEIMQRQIERHDNFALKTEFSKDKWKKRKEKK